MEYFKNQIVWANGVGLDNVNKRMKNSTAFLILTVLVGVAGPVFAGADAAPIDCTHSTLTVYVYKTGILSTLGHNHEIEAPIEWGEVHDSKDMSVALRVNSSKLRVLDAEVPPGTRATIQATMQSAEVLDVSRFPEIHYQSTAVEPSGTGH